MVIKSTNKRTVLHRVAGGDTWRYHTVSESARRLAMVSSILRRSSKVGRSLPLEELVWKDGFLKMRMSLRHRWLRWFNVHLDVV